MKKTSRHDYIIVIAAILLMIGYYLILNSGKDIKAKSYDEKIYAAHLMKKAMDTVRVERLNRGFKIDRAIDINDTGLIGLEYSEITTTLGALEAKRTSTNPDFAAVIVDMFKSLRLKKGDCVAVNLSGSFPALNIAVISAVQALELEPVIISSVGASTFGANITDFNYMDMEELLYAKGVLKYKSIASSIGGADDIGKEMDSSVVEGILNKIQDYGRMLLYNHDLKKNIKSRFDIYNKNNIQCFINVGGNLASIGEADWDGNFDPGILRDKNAIKGKADGLISLFLKSEIPVINMLNVKKLAVEYGLPIDPYPMPSIGKTNVYFERSNPAHLAWIPLVLGILTMFYYCRVRGKNE